jgi:DNA-binding PadR family transcriptional regulator
MGRKSRSKYAILGILSQGARSGYDIKKEITGSIDHFWHESFGQIYPTLKQLHEDGLVTKTTELQDGRPDRHVYAITETGNAVLLEWLRQPVALLPGRNELLLKLFFGRNLTPQENIAHLEKHRERMLASRQLYQQMAENLQAKIPDNPDLPYYLITLNHGIHVTQAIADWCEETIDRLKQTGGAGDYYHESTKQTK